MFKKIVAGLAVAAMLLLATPAAANAVQYTNGSPCRFDVNVVRAGDTATLVCVPGTWAALETVDWSITGSNGFTARFASFTTAPNTSAHFAKSVAADGSDVLKIFLPTSAVGLYSIVGHGRISDHTCPTSLTVLPADRPASASSSSSSSSDLAATGSIILGWIVWIAVGLLVLGLIVLLITRRRRRTRSN